MRCCHSTAPEVGMQFMKRSRLLIRRTDSPVKTASSESPCSRRGCLRLEARRFQTLTSLVSSLSWQKKTITARSNWRADLTKKRPAQAQRSRLRNPFWKKRKTERTFRYLLPAYFRQVSQICSYPCKAFLAKPLMSIVLFPYQTPPRTRVCQPRTRVCQLWTRVCQLWTRVCQLSTRFRQLSTRFRQLRTRFRQLSTRFRQLRTRFCQLRTRFRQLSTRFRQLLTRFRRPSSSLKLRSSHPALSHRE